MFNKSETDHAISNINKNGDMELFKYLIEGLGITAMASFGIIGNILSLMVITRPKFKSSISWLLIGLSFFDLLFLTLNIFIYSLIAIFNYLQIGESYVSSMNPIDNLYLLYVNDTAQTASIYFTVFIAFQRYLVVTWPVESRTFCTYERCRIVSVFIVLFSCAYQTLRLLFPQEDLTVDYTELAKECPDVAMAMNNSQPGAEADYENYFFRWPYMTFLMILPSLCLIWLNVSIWLTVVRGQKKRLEIVTRKSEDKERSITIMLLVVVLVFLICQLDYYIMAIIEGFYTCIWKSWNVYLISVDLFLITTNSSANFLIYCTFGTKFREEFNRLLCIKKVKRAVGIGYSVDSSSNTGTKKSTDVTRAGDPQVEKESATHMQMRKM